MHKTEDPASRAGRIVSGAALGVLGVAFAGTALLPALPERIQDQSDYVLPDARIDINSADAGTLALLPGIGATLSERIVADRAMRGAFSNADELDRVHGIGPRKVEGVQGYVVVR